MHISVFALISKNFPSIGNACLAGIDVFGTDIANDIINITYICYMSDKERKEFTEAIKKYTTKLSKSKAASKQFLVDTGIITERGNLREPYKQLCTLQEVD